VKLVKDKSAKILGEVIVYFRKKSGISQEQLSLDSGLARSFVSEIERGIKFPTVHTLMVIGASLGVRPSAIMSELESRLKWKD